VAKADDGGGVYVCVGHMSSTRALIIDPMSCYSLF
jgi:hypothetical protein